MTFSVRRWLLLLLAATAVYVGVWAAAAPASWWRSFPGAGHRWLPVLGDYNEHLARDVGAFNLALAVLAIGAARRPADGFLVRLTALAWLTFSVPHLLYHLGHLAPYAPIDRAGNVLSLGLVVLAPAVLLLPARAGRDAAENP
ncbi:hypothetical protein [Couchioplanes caeruleus]|uniref:Uncharacterized protein n=2 Tax=Couchioplanes caeruleus TaxID=56438 RepID=A0A1K0GCI7_9ACTN|nr:hypothetical protein [Couchioplanes caeruleus]OJF14946.1 hypothetical protein BG844_07050 [Couchioplanes caeruleus subsp. caeruleus]ROP30449.1 hypothetical protein EDD30_3300 [Couchioplanes caeruleus]